MFPRQLQVCSMLAWKVIKHKFSTQNICSIHLHPYMHPYTCFELIGQSETCFQHLPTETWFWVQIFIAVRPFVASQTSWRSSTSCKRTSWSSAISNWGPTQREFERKETKKTREKMRKIFLFFQSWTFPPSQHRGWKPRRHDRHDMHYMRL